jgi:Txe/YoeB family toxin of toxin-antitoxin system
MQRSWFKVIYETRRKHYSISLKSIHFRIPPSYEKLVGDLSGAYSRRINIQHRLVYEVIESENTVKILRMWTHYE